MFTDEIIPTVHIDAQSFPPITSAGKVRDPESQCPDDHEKAFQSEVETFWLQEKSVMEAKAQQKAKIVSREWQQDGVTLQTAVKLVGTYIAQHVYNILLVLYTMAISLPLIACIHALIPNSVLFHNLISITGSGRTCRLV